MVRQFLLTSQLTITDYHDEHADSGWHGAGSSQLRWGYKILRMARDGSEIDPFRSIPNREDLPCVDYRLLDVGPELSFFRPLVEFQPGRSSL